MNDYSVLPAISLLFLSVSLVFFFRRFEARWLTWYTENEFYLSS